jgi:Tol biopolymer transport system component
MSTRNGVGQIFVMDADGSDQHRLVTPSGIEGEPSWSPDGRQIVFDRRSKDGIDIVIADADSSHDHAIVPACVGKCQDIYWPDSSWQPLR